MFNISRTKHQLSLLLVQSVVVIMKKVKKCIKLKKVQRRKVRSSNKSSVFIPFKGCDNIFNSCINEYIIKLSHYFPDGYSHFDVNVKVELDLSNCAANSC